MPRNCELALYTGFGPAIIADFIRHGATLALVEGENKFVTRSGLKLEHALTVFGIDAAGTTCADLGSHQGGFVDCLLHRGAAKVYSVDTSYGTLAWKLRKDPSVVVMERTNAMHVELPEQVDLVTIDVGWTPQQHIIPAAMRWLRTDAAGRPAGRIVSLLKPHYELTKLQGCKPAGALTAQQARGVCLAVCDALAKAGCAPVAVMQSPLAGKGGNAEFLLLFDTTAPG